MIETVLSIVLVGGLFVAALGTARASTRRLLDSNSDVRGILASRAGLIPTKSRLPGERQYPGIANTYASYYLLTLAEPTG
jgi:hypothetical protein